jgi:hypothetical protein
MSGNPQPAEFKVSRSAPSESGRIGFSLLVAVVVGICVFAGWQRSTLHPDLWQPLIGAQSLLAGVDPYPLVGPGRQYEHEFLFIYPLTSSVILVPLGLLSWQTATAVFSGVSAGLFAHFAGYERWPVLLSFPFISAAWAGQWGTLFSVAFLVPSLSFLFVAKPTTGLALLAARFDQKSLFACVAGATVLLAVSLAIVPRWPIEWLTAVGSNTGHMTLPLLRPGGFIALFALLRWRRSEARLIAFLAMVPQTVLWYEVVPLFLVARTFRQSLTLMVLTSLPIIYEILFASQNGTVELWPKDYQLALFAYLPCVVMVLLRKNERERHR